MSLCWGGLRRIHVLLSPRGKGAAGGRGVQGRKRGRGMNAKTAVGQQQLSGSRAQKSKHSIKRQEASHSSHKRQSRRFLGLGEREHERDLGACTERGLNRHQVDLRMSAVV